MLFNESIIYAYLNTIYSNRTQSQRYFLVIMKHDSITWSILFYTVVLSDFQKSPCPINIIIIILSVKRCQLDCASWESENLLWTNKLVHTCWSTIRCYQSANHYFGLVKLSTELWLSVTTCFILTPQQHHKYKEATFVTELPKQHLW